MGCQRIRDEEISKIEFGGKRASTFLAVLVIALLCVHKVYAQHACLYFPLTCTGQSRYKYHFLSRRPRFCCLVSNWLKQYLLQGNINFYKRDRKGKRGELIQREKQGENIHQYMYIYVYI